MLDAADTVTGAVETVARGMPDDIDIVCGGILEDDPVAAVGELIFERLIRVASGEKTASERLGYCGADFVP